MVTLVIDPFVGGVLIVLLVLAIALRELRARAVAHNHSALILTMVEDKMSMAGQNIGPAVMAALSQAPLGEDGQPVGNPPYVEMMGDLDTMTRKVLMEYGPVIVETLNEAYPGLQRFAGGGAPTPGPGMDDGLGGAANAAGAYLDALGDKATPAQIALGEFARSGGLEKLLGQPSQGVQVPLGGTAANAGTSNSGSTAQAL